MLLGDALEQTPTATLRQIARAHALRQGDDTTRAELIAHIAERFADQAYLREQLKTLSEDERSVLASARAAGGELRGLLVQAEHPASAEALAERGWLYRVFAANGPIRGEIFVLPDELLEVLPAPPAGRAELPAGEASPPSERRASDPTFSLFALASAVMRDGGPGRLEQEVRSWSEEPGGWRWDTRWSFLQHLATSAGLLVTRADGVLAPAPSLPRLLDDPPRLAERLWRAYLRTTSWAELGLLGFEGSAELLDTLGVRRAVADLIHEFPENGWISLHAVSDWLQRSHPTLIREQLTPRGLIHLQNTDWAEFDEPLIRAFVLGPLYWLGVTSASRDGRMIARRPSRTAAGELVHEACSWNAGASAELLASPRARLGLLLQAERYLVLRERGRVSRYHLVQAHVAAALASGGSVQDCRELLGKLTQAPLPPSVDDRLDSWEQRFGALDIRPAVLLAARSASDLDSVLDDERVRPFLRARLGPTIGEVAAADAFELAAALREAGHLPRVDAALRLGAEPRRAYSGMVDEQVLEFLLVSLLAFRSGWPERLAELEGSQALLERLEHQFPRQRLAELRAEAQRLAGRLTSARPAAASARSGKRRRRKRATRSSGRASHPAV